MRWWTRSMKSGQHCGSCATSIGWIKSRGNFCCRQWRFCIFLFFCFLSSNARHMILQVRVISSSNEFTLQLTSQCENWKPHNFFKCRRKYEASLKIISSSHQLRLNSKLHQSTSKYKDLCLLWTSKISLKTSKWLKEGKRTACQTGKENSSHFSCNKLNHVDRLNERKKTERNPIHRMSSNFSFLPWLKISTNISNPLDLDKNLK